MGRNLGDFYHGSAHHFKPGDTVEPRSDWGFAWASTNRDVAASYGPRVYRVEPIGDVKRQPGAGKEFGIYNSRTGFRVLGEDK